MPALERIGRYQKAVMWPYTGRRDGFGETQIGSPVELVVRWTFTESNDSGAQEETDKLVASAVSAVSIPLDSIMWLGALADWSTARTTAEANGTDIKLYIVKSTKDTPDIKGRQIKHRVDLSRYKQQLPT